MENYKIIKYLNEGSYGKIYLVEKKDTKNLYALKSIKIFGIDRYNKVSILNEIRILLINNNDYLLKCYDIFIHNKKLCIITEYIDGGDLDNYVKKNKLKEDEIIKIFLKICVGINSLHNNNIIHRDIKPANILITKNGEIKVCDFGICKFLDYNKVTNTSIGTPYFMSPEQMNVQYYDYKIDVWGIGCVLYYLLYNKYPFNGANMHQLKYNIRTQNPFINMHAKLKFISNNNRFRIEQILKEMFEKNKQKRMDLNMFLNNSKELLKFHNIENKHKKFKHYYFKSVPNTENDWNNVIKQVYYDFQLPNTPRKNIDSMPKLNNNTPVKQPDIVTYSEMKNKKYNISPMPPLPPSQISKPNNKHISQIKPQPPPSKVQSVPTPQLPPQPSPRNVEEKKYVYHRYDGMIAPTPPRYPKIKPTYRPNPKIYVHSKRASYMEDLHRIKVENNIKERYKRIEAQQKCINEQRKFALKQIKEQNSKLKSSIVINKRHINPSPNVMKRKLYNDKIVYKNKIKNVESKIKHLWAPSPPKKTVLINNITKPKLQNLSKQKI